MTALKKKFNWRLFIRNRRYLLYAIGAGLLSIIVIWQATVPLVTSILDINQDIARQNQLVAQLQQKAARLKELETQNIANTQQSVNAILPSRKPVLELLAGLNVVAGRTGVAFTDFAISPGEIATNSAETSALAQAKVKKGSKNIAAYDTLTVILTAEGTFGQVQNFLRQVEQIAPFTTVTDLDLNIRRRQGGIVETNDFVSAEMLLDTHYYTQSLKAALTSPLPVTTTKHDQVLSQLQTFIFPTIEEQRAVISGGRFDLFGVDSAQFLEEVQR